MRRITLREYKHCAFQVATAGTVSVYDRRGKRLITVYLAHPPKPGQATMDQMLTGLLTELFERYSGPLPRLAYVTDSGSQETGYFRKVLRRMVHPRTGKRLEWIRVADYYHASERIWTMADVLFGKGTREANAWARRMLKSRTKIMRYRDYASVHIPLGSGVTEAACKTVFTQRLKNSGMRWSHDGAKTILTLRTILLSRSWASTYLASLTAAYPDGLRPYRENKCYTAIIAA